MAIYPCPISKLSDDKAAVWEQPAHSEIQFTSDGFAVVSLLGIEQLHQYDTTLPSGVYAGKMWKRDENGTLYLCWFQNSDLPGQCDIKYRKILSKEVFELLNPGGRDNQ